MSDLELLTYRARFNAEIESWGKSTRSAFLRKIQQLPFKERALWKTRAMSDVLRGKIAVRYRRQFGDIIRVGYPFARHGIFQEHGVGRGRKKGSAKVKPMPWINPTFDATVPLLADALKDESIRSLKPIIRIKVNGIFEAELR